MQPPEPEKKSDDGIMDGITGCVGLIGIIIMGIYCFFYGLPGIKDNKETPVPVIGGPPITDYKGQKWEYKNIIVPAQNLSGFKDQENTYTSLGNQGWEYAGFIDKPPQPYIIFKRPVSK